MLEALWKGITLGLLLSIAVGPVVFSIIKQSINNGQTGGFSFVAGVWASDILLVVLSNAFSEWVTHIMAYKQMIGYVGSIFLVVMGVYFVFFKKVKLRTTINGDYTSLSKKDFLKF